jgi:hypothetical protein
VTSLRLVHDGGPSVDEYRPLTEAERIENMRRARTLLERLHGLVRDASDLEAGAGVCSDCGHDALMRWALGRVVLCRVCFSSRSKVAAPRAVARAS